MMHKLSPTLRTELTDILYTHNKQGWIGSLALWLGALFAYDFPNVTAAYVFSILVLIFSAYHIVNAVQYANKTIRQSKTPQYWIKTASLISALQGSTIGLTPWFLLDLYKQPNVYLITALLILPMFGSAIISGTSKTVHLIWSLTSSIPLVLLLLLSDQREYQIMAMMILVTAIPVSILMNLYFHRLFSQMIKLQYQNLDLLNDVQRQQLIAEKESSEKSRFIAATSHDLRQPLHALNLYLGALGSKLTQADTNELLNKAQHSSQVLSELLNALMDMSRLDAGIVTANKSIHNVADLIHALIIDLKPLIENTELSLTYQLETALINTDPILFSQIIRNLTTNAILHNENCNINLSVEIHNNEVIISIKDTGKGIASTELTNIFSEFYQLDNPERDRNKGLGLGLSIVKKLTSLLDIQLSVKSELNKGACFSLTLPLDTRVISSPINQERQKTIDLTGLFIMIVDDNEMVCDSLKILLMGWQCEVLTAPSEAQLMKEIHSDNYPKPDIIISDYRLKNNKNGIQVIQSLRTHYDHNIPSIIISGDTSNNMKSEIHDISCELLYKPLNAQQLRATLEKTLLSSQ